MPKIITDESTNSWKKTMTMIRDIVFIILFLSTVAGWITSSIKNRTKTEVYLEILNDKFSDTSKQLEKMNNILLEQKELNGKIIQYMQSR